MNRSHISYGTWLTIGNAAMFSTPRATTYNCRRVSMDCINTEGKKNRCIKTVLLCEGHRSLYTSEKIRCEAHCDRSLDLLNHHCNRRCSVDPIRALIMIIIRCCGRNNVKEGRACSPCMDYALGKLVVPVR